MSLALLAARRRLDLACAVAGAAGVVLLTGGPSGASLAGVALGLGAAGSVALSIVVGARVGRQTDGLEGLALAVGAAAIYSVLLSLDPAVAVLAGLLLLGQAPRVADLTGIALVVAASATAVSTRHAT